MTLTPSKLIAAGLSANAVAALTDGQQPTSDVVTTISTVGAGTLTAAGLVGGVILRSGAQSATAFSDATDTAANIVAAIPNAQAGQSVRCVIKNNTDGAQTITAGSGVTLAGQTIIAANTWCEFTIVLTSLTAVAITGVESGRNVVMPLFKRVAIVANTSTLSAGDMEGAHVCFLNCSGQATPSFTTRTGAQIAANIPNIQIGFNYVVRVINANSGQQTMVAGSGVTISGTATLATNTWREFMMAYTAADTFTMTSVGTGTTS
jgi:hypothetical protein